MAQIKAHEVDRYLKNPDSRHRVFLIYGPDNGLVSERANLAAKASGAALDDPFSTIRLDADDAAAEPTRIADEAFTVSMFGGQRLVWIKGSTQKNLVKAIEPVLATPPTDCVVVIEGGDLKKSSPLRKRIEACSTAVALPCYADQARSLTELVDSETRSLALEIDPDARALLISLLGGDRLASRREVEKLCLYAADQGRISSDDVKAIVGDAAALAVDVVVDAASTGDLATMEHMLKRLLAQGTAVFHLMNSTQRHFQMLHQARCQMDQSGSAEQAVGRMRPPVNFQRKALVTKALSIWKKPALERTLERLKKVSLESRANAALSAELASTALLAIAIEARQLSR